MSEQCRATAIAHERRYTGVGRTGYEMRYRRKQCGRPAQDDTGYCWQHQPIAARLAACERQEEG